MAMVAVVGGGDVIADLMVVVMMMMMMLTQVVFVYFCAELPHTGEQNRKTENERSNKFHVEFKRFVLRL